MKKLILLLFVAIVTCSLYAQTYTIVSRDNETIKMYRNALGETSSALKSVIPGSKPEPPQYRLIKKTYQGKESMIFIDFTKILDKILVAYEIDMETPCEWHMTTISYSDLYNAVTRKNAIYLSGEILGMKVEVFQRPPVLWEDIVNIDGVEFPLPLKVCAYESDLVQKAEKEKEKALQKAEKEMKEKKDGFDERAITELATKEENKAYIALLIRTQSYDLSYVSDIRKYFDYAELQRMMETYTVEQLEEKSKGHSKFFERYEAYR